MSVPVKLPWFMSLEETKTRYVADSVALQISRNSSSFVIAQLGLTDNIVGSLVTGSASLMCHEGTFSSFRLLDL
jgi:hypothetical protein